MSSGPLGLFFENTFNALNKILNEHFSNINKGINESDGTGKDAEASSIDSNSPGSFQKLLENLLAENNPDTPEKAESSKTESSNNTDNPSNPSNSSSDDMVQLRSEALNRGIHVEVDRLDESIYIDGKKYRPDDLLDEGAIRYSTTSWRIPENILPDNPSGNRAPEDRPTDTILDPTNKFTEEDMTSELRKAREKYESTRYNLDALSKNQAKERLEEAAPGSEREKALKNYIKAGRFGWDNPIYSTGDYTSGATARDRSEAGFSTKA